MNDGVEIECKILSLLRRKSNYHKYRNIIKTDFFQVEATRQAYSLIGEYFEEDKIESRKLLVSDLKLLIHKKIKNIDLRRECIDISNKLRSYKTRDNPVLESLIKDFSSRQLIKKGILAGLEELEKPTPNFNIIQEHIEKALLVSKSSDRDHYNYFDEPEERILRESKESRIMSGIPKLDEVIDGGFGPGELIIFLAPPERGKTLSLVNVGTAALRQGKRVGFITLELSERKVARRFDLRITGRSIDLLRRDPGRIKNPLASLRRNGCDLVIKDYSAEDPKMEDIKSFIISYQNRMRAKFDMLIIDYADLISPTKMYKQERFGIKEVYKSLRRLANELKIPIVTASQANRKSMSKLVITMEDFDECFAKAAIADVVIGVCQSPEELEDELCRLYIAKNRSSGKHLSLRITMKPKIMYLGELHNFDKERNKSKKTIADRI